MNKNNFASLSVCMIVKNEESVLERCLECVKQFANEIIIVDTLSTDKTKEIALKYIEKNSLETTYIIEKNFPIRPLSTEKNHAFTNMNKIVCRV